MRHNAKLILFFCLALIVAFTTCTDCYAQKKDFIRIPKQCPSYFMEGEKAWIPIEMNCLVDHKKSDSKSLVLADYERIFKIFSDNGGNAVRIWMGPGNFLNVEDSLGIYDKQGIENLEALVKIAEKYNIRLKICLEIARDFSGKGVFNKKGYRVNDGGKFNFFKDLLNTKEGKQAYLNRAKFYAKYFKNNPTIYCWDLWNEINAVSEGNWAQFSKEMLDSFKVIFPNQLSVSSLGSLDCKKVYSYYDLHFTHAKNDFLMAHRYWDMGAEDSICHKPIDVFLADATEYLRNKAKAKCPVFINETGAVEPKHSSWSKLYKSDTSGIMMDDMLFTPFFCGAAGSGSLWDYWHYVEPNNLWSHFRRFKDAIKDIDAVKENFRPIFFSHNGVRFYGLVGSTCLLIWCRNAQQSRAVYDQTMESLIQPLVPSFNLDGDFVKGINVENEVQVYDPWKNITSVVKKWNDKFTIPGFERSVVLKFKIKHTQYSQ